MQLIITDLADKTVGLNEKQFKIECPFEKGELPEEDLEWFKNKITDIYQEFSN